MNPMPERSNMVFFDDREDGPPLTKEDLDKYISFFDSIAEEFQTQSIIVIVSTILVKRETLLGT